MLQSGYTMNNDDLLKKIIALFEAQNNAIADIKQHQNRTEAVLAIQSKAITEINQHQNRTDAVLNAQTQTITEINQHQNRTNTVLDALKAGLDDIREKMATKEDVSIAVSTAKEELQANIFDLGAKVQRTLHNHETRIKNLERHTGTSDPTKN